MAEADPLARINAVAEALRAAARERREQERALGYPEFMDVEDYLTPEDREKLKEANGDGQPE